MDILPAIIIIWSTALTLALLGFLTLVLVVVLNDIITDLRNDRKWRKRNE